jgi:hypothetical protein
LNAPSPPFSFIPSPPIPRIVSISLIFPFLHTCTQYLHYIHPSAPFPHLFPSPTGPPVLPSCSMILQEKKKNISYFLGNYQDIYKLTS